jgi:protein HIRA/HIR1
LNNKLILITFCFVFSIYRKPSPDIFLKNRLQQSSATLSFIDQKLNAAFSLQSSRDYQFWLTALARHLVQEGIESRFRELCECLLGPPLRSEFSDWNTKILGLDKHDLLREVLKVSASNLKLQRIYLEFKEQLELVTLV